MYQELIKAIHENDIKCIETILDFTSADIVETPLYIAVGNNNYEICKMILAEEADPNSKNGESSETPFDYAIRIYCSNEYDKLDIIELLLQYKANPNVVGYVRYNVDHYTPLQKAIMSDKLDLVKLLLNYQADLDKNSLLGTQTDLHSLAHYFDEDDNNGILINIEIAQLIVDKYTDINIRDNDGKTVFYKACSIGNTDLAKFLLSKGADPFIKSNEGKLCIEETYSDLYEFLLELGLSPNPSIEGYWSLLHDAAKENEVETVKILLKYGVDKDVKHTKQGGYRFFPEDNAIGETPLEVAKRYGHSEIVELLEKN